MELRLLAARTRAHTPLASACEAVPLGAVHHGPTHKNMLRARDGRSYGYSNQMGYQTSDFRLLWTITPHPPPHPNTLSNPPPPRVKLPPPAVVPPNIRLVPLSPHP